MINELVNILLTPFGFTPFTLSEITQIFANSTKWYQLLTPNAFIPFLFYIALGWGMLYVVFIMPFRFFKNWLRVPDRKGKR